MCNSEKEPHMCKCGVSSVNQTLDEMDWERGIWYAALLGDTNRVQFLLERDGAANATDNSGYTPLHYAARNGHIGICGILIERGALVNAQTKSGKATPLHRAAAAGQTEAVQLLLRCGACVEIQDADGQTAIHKAAQFGHAEIGRILLETAPKLKDAKDLHGRTASDFYSLSLS